jgi:hypothetical protein
MSEIKVDTLTGKTSAGDITVTSEGGAATMQLQQGLAKGWVSFNGTGTIATDDSFNLSSLVDAGTGAFEATWANSMNTSIYVMTGMQSHSVSNTSCNCKIASRSSNFTSSTVRVNTMENATVNDSDYVSMMCHGDLA